MAVNWSLLGPPQNPGDSFNQGFQQAREFKRKQDFQGALARYVQNPGDTASANKLLSIDPLAFMEIDGRIRKQRAAAQEADALQQIRMAAATNGPAAARDAAIALGDPEAAAQWDKLDPKNKEQIAGRFKAAAPLAYEMARMPADQRAGFFEKSKPLLKSAGWSDEELANFNPADDTQLKTVLAYGQTVEQLRNRDSIKYIARPGQGGALIPVDDMGNRLDVPGGPQASYEPQPAPAPASTYSGTPTFNAPEGARVTSSTRSAAHNKAVGGVANSWHLTGMARDFVPPSGMSMGELEADLRRRNPGMEVINEGDHVHLEPPGSPPRQAGPDPAKVRADAQAAIAAGADPAKVRAKAKSMGVDL